jgi:hypothetical protein
VVVQHSVFAGGKKKLLLSAPLMRLRMPTHFIYFFRGPNPRNHRHIMPTVLPNPFPDGYLEGQPQRIDKYKQTHLYDSLPFDLMESINNTVLMQQRKKLAVCMKELMGGPARTIYDALCLMRTNANHGSAYNHPEINFSKAFLRIINCSRSHVYRLAVTSLSQVLDLARMFHYEAYTAEQVKVADIRMASYGGGLHWPYYGCRHIDIDESARGNGYRIPRSWTLAKKKAALWEKWRRSGGTYSPCQCSRCVAKFETSESPNTKRRRKE